MSSVIGPVIKNVVGDLGNHVEGGDAFALHARISIELPEELARFALPVGVGRRLRALLDKQGRGDELTTDERAEAEGLVSLAELLDLLRLRARAYDP